MAVNKVVYGDTVLMDLSDSTVTEDTLAEGATAYNAAGEKITGKASFGGKQYFGTEHHGKLVYVGEDGYLTVITLGAGLAIKDGALCVVDPVASQTAILNQAKLGSAYVGVSSITTTAGQSKLGETFL